MLFSFKYLFPLIATQLVPLFFGERSKAVSDNCRVCMYLRAEFKCYRVVIKKKMEAIVEKNDDSSDSF